MDYSHRLSPHSIRYLLELWVMSSFHVVLNTEPPQEFQQSLCPVHCKLTRFTLSYNQSLYNQIMPGTHCFFHLCVLLCLIHMSTNLLQSAQLCTLKFPLIMTNNIFSCRYQLNVFMLDGKKMAYASKVNTHKNNFLQIINKTIFISYSVIFFPYL